MNLIMMSFDDNSPDINVVYSKLKKEYPRVKITKKIKKTENPAIRAMKKMQKVMAGKAEELGFHSEEDAIKWIYEVRNETRREERGENII